MKLALLPLPTRPRFPQINWATLKQRLDQIALHKPRLVLLPECTLTGYLYTQADLARFAEPIPGPTTAALGGLARRYGFFLGAGLLEHTPQGVYDSAVILNLQGEIVLHARKVYEQPPFLRATAPDLEEIEGFRLGVLICGDLFHEPAVQTLQAQQPDLIWVPLARSFAGQSPDPDRWYREERGVYIRQAARLKAWVALVNALEVDEIEPAFGGALVVSPSGEVLAEAPHGSDQTLVVEVPL